MFSEILKIHYLEFFNWIVIGQLVIISTITITKYIYDNRQKSSSNTITILSNSWIKINQKIINYNWHQI